MMDVKTDPRFKGLEPFPSRVWLSSPTMHGDEQRWVDDAIMTNWVSTVGKNIDMAELETARKIGRKYAVGMVIWPVLLYSSICASVSWVT